MTHALNMTLPLKQDAETQGKAEALGGQLRRPTVQPKIEKALKKSRLVHFARVLVIDNKYIQVITEYEGRFTGYTPNFSARELAHHSSGRSSSSPRVRRPRTKPQRFLLHMPRITTSAALGLGQAWLTRFSAANRQVGSFSAYDHKDVRNDPGPRWGRLRERLVGARYLPPEGDVD